MTHKVFVYRNLHKNCWSLKQDGKVFARAGWVQIFSACEENGTRIPCTAGFKVNQKGRDRVLLEKKKNVHAFAWGYEENIYYYGNLASGVDRAEADNDFVKVFWNAEKDSLVQVSYNPYKAGYFFRKDTGAPVSYAKKIWLTPDMGVWALDPLP
jgi:hypothetical protein